MIGSMTTNLFPAGLRAVLVACGVAFLLGVAGPARAGSAQPAIGPTGVIVTSQFGGQIFGFDIDQGSNLGILCESTTLGNNKMHAAVETFDQTTGAIVKVVRETTGRDDFIALGVVGRSVGLVEREHIVGFLDVQRSFNVLNPLRRSRFTGAWTPPVGTDHLVSQVSRNQGVDNVAVYAMDVSGAFRPTVLVPMSRRTRSGR
jgi:hypothetical protein